MILNIDASITQWLFDNWHENDIINDIFKVITNLGEKAFIWLAIACGFIIYHLIKKDYRKAIMYSSLICVIFLSWLINDFGVKNLIARARPCANNLDYQAFLNYLHIEIPTDYSMPSGHSLSSFTAVGLLAWINRKHLIYALPLALLIGFSRIFMGVHYFTDVLAGAAAGFAIGVGTYYLVKFLLNKFFPKDPKKPDVIIVG